MIIKSSIIYGIIISVAGSVTAGVLGYYIIKNEIPNPIAKDAANIDLIQSGKEKSVSTISTPIFAPETQTPTLAPTFTSITTPSPVQAQKEILTVFPTTATTEITKESSSPIPSPIESPGEEIGPWVPPQLFADYNLKELLKPSKPNILVESFDTYYPDKYLIYINWSPSDYIVWHTEKEDEKVDYNIDGGGSIILRKRIVEKDEEGSESEKIAEISPGNNWEDVDAGGMVLDIIDVMENIKLNYKYYAVYYNKNFSLGYAQDAIKYIESGNLPTIVDYMSEPDSKQIDLNPSENLCPLPGVASVMKNLAYFDNPELYKNCPQR